MNPKDYSQMMAYLTRPAMARGGRIGFSTAGLVKNLLKKIPEYKGIGRKDRTPEKNFMK